MDSHSFLHPLVSADPEIADLILKEHERQAATIDLIASENHISAAIRLAQGSLLTDKYAEGYPGRRYYSGCGIVDDVERLAAFRAQELFGADHANVQPHAGSQANFAAYQALIRPGATILGMDRNHGGHLTHGAEVNFSGRLYHIETYGVERETEILDYNHVRKIALQVRPDLIVAGASSYPRALDFKAFGSIAQEVGAALMVDIAHIGGLIAGGAHMSPVPYADVVTGTTQKTLRGPRGGFILCKSCHAGVIDASVFPGSQGGPLMHAIAAKAICFRDAMTDGFRDYAARIVVNAQAMADELAAEGMRVVSGGTDNHLVLVDLANLGITGKQAQDALEHAGIVANRNSIPFDTQPPAIAGGLRVGAPAITTRGFSADEARQVARLICLVLREPASESVASLVRTHVAALCEAHPLPGLGG
jgi:glycine hydroxymethyltransferase